jgi:hypothetical protein
MVLTSYGDTTDMGIELVEKKIREIWVEWDD